MIRTIETLYVYVVVSEDGDERLVVADGDLDRLKASRAYADKQTRAQLRLVRFTRCDDLD
jgi:hypothetical protein